MQWRSSFWHVLSHCGDVEGLREWLSVQLRLDAQKPAVQGTRKHFANTLRPKQWRRAPGCKPEKQAWFQTLLGSRVFAQQVPKLQEKSQTLTCSSDAPCSNPKKVAEDDWK